MAGGALGAPGTGLDTPYVVKLHSAFQVADTQPLFRFEHPNKMPQHLIDNSRYVLVITSGLTLSYVTTCGRIYTTHTHTHTHTHKSLC
jgi:hypothetical protein